MVARFFIPVLALHCCVIASFALPSPRSQDLSSTLKKHVADYTLDEAGAVEALIRVSNDFHVPMGIAWMDSPSARAKQHFVWKNATVQEMVESIVKTQPGYQVLQKNGVIHIDPSNDLIPDNQNFLSLKLESFEIHDEQIELASFKLHMLVTPRKYGLISIAGPGDSPVSVQLRNCTVEDALDALVVNSNRKIWVATFSADPGLTARGLRRSLALWNGAAGPDEEQPSWSFLRWGDPMPPLIAAKSTH